MKVEGFALRLRPRSAWEAADLGVRLAQTTNASIYPCYLLALVPVLLLSVACYQISPSLAVLLLWWAKPWLDRSILFALSRAAFGQTTRPRDLWLARRDIWWRQFWRSWTLRRLSPWRAFTEPVYQLEGLRGKERRQRIVRLRSGRSGAAALVTSAFATAEEILTLSMLSLAFWFAPSAPHTEWTMQGVFGAGLAMTSWTSVVSYLIAILLLEPLYVSAGFAMYLNRRVELEAWDIEQEFRRAFAR